MTEEDFIRNTNEDIKMVNSKPREESKRKPIKRTRKTKSFSKFVIAAICGGLITAASVPTVQAIAGAREITSKFYDECMDGISERLDSQKGYVMTLDGEHVDFEVAVDDMVRQGRSNGYSDEEIYISLSKLYNIDTAKEAIGEMDNDDLKDTAREYYLENKAEEVRTHGR